MRSTVLLLIIAIPFQLHAQTYFKTLVDFPKEGQYSRGVAWGDLNGDLWPDIVVGNEAVEGAEGFNTIYWNQKGKGFRMESLDNNHAWTEGVYLVDVDNDHDLDIFCSTDKQEANRLYINDGKGNFELTQAGDLTSDPLDSPGACWCDYDLDGDLDVFVLGKDRQDDRLYKNNGKLNFKAIMSGPWVGKENEARSCVWGDLNGDNMPDLYINNYIERSEAGVTKLRNFLYYNTENGFKEITTGDLVNIKRAGYGNSIVDIDSDGDLDLYVSNIAMSDDNGFYSNDGLGNFETIIDKEFTKYLRRPSKGHFWADFNLDGLIDLYIANGTVGAPVRYPEIQNFLFIQNPDSSFQRIYADESVMLDNVSAGTAGGDYDLDGDIDIIVTNWEHGKNNNIAYANQSIGKNWVKLKLYGQESNSYGIGAWVTITTSENGIMKTQKRYHYPYTGYGSMSEPIIHFGIGESDMISSIEVQWPNGNKNRFSAVSPNKFYLLKENGELTNLTAN